MLVNKKICPTRQPMGFTLRPACFFSVTLRRADADVAHIRCGAGIRSRFTARHGVQNPRTRRVFAAGSCLPTTLATIHQSALLLRPCSVHPEIQKVFKILYHIESCGTCMKH